MKTKYTAIALILASGLIAGTSFAEALRTGDFMVVGEELSAKCNELHPNMHRSI
jgi:hypothetical protein